MMRLFVAVRPPPAVRDGLLATMGGVAAARWQDDDQLHLTLRFIGEVDRHTAADIAEALTGIRHPPIAARLGLPGSFASRGRPNALWVGVEPAGALATLHHKVDHALVRAGVPPDTRAFVPHITVARLGRNTGSIDGFLGQTVPSTAFTVSGITLFESILTRTAAAYRPVADYRMANEIK